MSFIIAITPFSEKICWFYWASRVFSEKTLLKILKSKQVILVNHRFYLGFEKTEYRNIAPACYPLAIPFRPVCGTKIQNEV